MHAPHHPIGGLKDFFIHIVTITVGLLIAVGIEGLVERHREHVLVREARETLREEITHNNTMMKKVVTDVAGSRAKMKKNIDYLTGILENPKDKAAQNGGLDATFGNITMDETAWKTAQTTGALGFMPYAEASKYSDIYLTQQMFNTQQDKIMEDEASVLGLVAQFDVGHGDMTAEQAGVLLKQFGVWQAHLLYLDLMAKLSSQEDQAFLEGKEAPKSMHEDLDGAFR